MIRKLVINDGASEREVVLAGPIVVGRDPSCHIHDLDPLLSQRHAEFVPGPESVTLRALGSRSGMLVNGIKVPQHTLAAGDVVQLGRLQLQYLEQDAPSSPHDAGVLDDEPMSIPDALLLFAPADVEETALPHRALASSDRGLDVTRASGRGDEAPIRAAAGQLDATLAPGRREPDATSAPGLVVQNMDLTRAPAPRNAGATCAPGLRDLEILPDPGVVPEDSATSNASAILVAGPDLVVTVASTACGDLLGKPPDRLVGEAIGDVIMQSVRRIAAGNGPGSLSLVIERRGADRSIAITFNTGRPTEDVS